MALLTSEAQVQDAVLAARAANTPLRIIGGGTRQPIGRPLNAATPLSTRGLTGITLYEPAEMVIAARAGTPLSQIRRTLAEHRQMLPFEPMDHRPLLGTTGEPTIGAVAAGNISGPRRISAGAARDSLIGVRFVNGRGEAIKSGGRVMKNVTGLDLVKLQAGAWGTLGVLTEVVFKLLPQPETSRTLVLYGLDDARGIAALSAGLTTPYEVSGAAHLPASATNARSCTMLRVEGFETSLNYRTKALSAALKSFGPAEIVPVEPSVAMWADVTSLTPLAGGNAAVWRISVKPGDGPGVVAAIRAAIETGYHFYDWGGGLVWLETPDTGDAGASIIRGAVAVSGGHATLVRAAPSTRAAVAPFQPEHAAIARLGDGIRAAMDPARLFNPGLMG